MEKTAEREDGPGVRTREYISRPSLSFACICKRGSGHRFPSSMNSREETDDPILSSDSHMSSSADCRSRAARQRDGEKSSHVKRKSEWNGNERKGEDEEWRKYHQQMRRCMDSLGEKKRKEIRVRMTGSPNDSHCDPRSHLISSSGDDAITHTDTRVSGKHKTRRDDESPAGISSRRPEPIYRPLHLL